MSVPVFTVTFGKYPQILHCQSIEEGLHALSRHFWPAPWKIEDSAGEVVARRDGDGLFFPSPPSLLARQILGMGDTDVKLDCSVWSETSDGEWVKLPDIDRGSSRPTDGIRPYRPSAIHPPIRFDDHASLDGLTIHHSNGRGRLRIDRRFLQLRPSKAKDRWDLVILNSLDGKNEPAATSKGTYFTGLDSNDYAAAVALGISVQEPRDPNAPIKTWKKGAFEIATDNEGGRREVIGYVREYFGIDRRPIQMKGYGNYTYTQLRYCLTHIPSGAGIGNWKHKKDVEDVADELRREVPELGWGADVAREVGLRVKALVFPDEAPKSSTPEPDESNESEEEGPVEADEADEADEPTADPLFYLIDPTGARAGGPFPVDRVLDILAGYGGGWTFEPSG